MAGPISITQDFRHEVEATTLKLLRRRFLWFLGTVGGIYGLSLIVLLAGLGAVAFGVGRDVAAQQILNLRGGYWGLMSVLVLTGMDVGVFVWFVREATARRNNREKLLRLTQQFLIYRVAVDLLAAWIWKVEGFPWTLAMYHTLACVLLPWTPLQALIPLLILIPLNAAVLLVSPARGITGDLVIKVSVEPHPVFSVSGRDLRVTVPVTFAEAALGAEIQVPTLAGTPVTVKVPAGTPSGRTLRVKGRGVPAKAGAGDLLATVQITVPQRLSSEARAAVEAFAAATPGDVRADLSARAKA